MIIYRIVKLKKKPIMCYQHLIKKYKNEQYFQQN